LSAHTKGPWEAEAIPGDSHRDEWAVWAESRRDGQEIIAVLGCEDSDPRRLARETEANAMLIAAAPDLADALQKLLARFDADSDCSGCELCLSADAALRKAGRLP
jgi:hypothetical protein